jgi:serine/threonine protein kinase
LIDWIVWPLKFGFRQNRDIAQENPSCWSRHFFFFFFFFFFEKANSTIMRWIKTRSAAEPSSALVTATTTTTAQDDGVTYPSKQQQTRGQERRTNRRPSTNNKNKNNKNNNRSSQQKKSTTLPLVLLPPPPKRKPRGCNCCQAPLEGRRRHRQRWQGGGEQQRQQRQQQRPNVVVDLPPLWESNGEPGLGWWSDMDHAADAAAYQLEMAARQQAERERQQAEQEQAEEEEEKAKNMEKEKGTDDAATGESHTPSSKKKKIKKTKTNVTSASAIEAALLCNNNPFENPDLFVFGGIGDMILPRPTPVTEIQDKQLAKHIASFAKARAREAAKSRGMERMLLAAAAAAAAAKQSGGGRNTGEQQQEQEDDDPASKMALFDYDELQLGELLGVGGFSHVYEIQGFNLENDSGATTSAAAANLASATAEDADIAKDSATGVGSISPRKDRSSFASRRRSSASTATAAGGRQSFTSFTTTNNNNNNSRMSRRRSSRMKSDNSYTPQQQLAREFLAQHALRADDDVTDRNDDDDDEDAIDARRALNAGTFNNNKQRRASSIMSTNPVAAYDPASHTREENSAHFRETRESVSTHLMENSTSFFSQDFQEELHNAARGSGKTTPRYAVKHLKPSLLQEVPMPNKFAKAAMDLACEAEMMMGLNHPNIVKLRGWATGGPSKFKEGKHTSYFLIMDRLTCTLQDRIADWRQQHQEQYSWKRRLDYMLKKIKFLARGCFSLRRRTSKGSSGGSPRVQRSASFSAASSKSFGCGPSSSMTMSPEELLLIERVKVAYDIACALEYLHEKRIVYRDLKATNIGFNVRGDVQIFDFGLSRYLPYSGQLKAATAAAAAAAAAATTTAAATCQEDEKETESQEIRRNDAKQDHVAQPLTASEVAALLDDDESYQMSHVGTRRYTAPEVDRKLPYNLKADVYSFGVVLWEIMSMSAAVSKGRKVNLVHDHASLQSAKSSVAAAAGKAQMGGRPAKRNNSSSRNLRSRVMVPCCCWPVEIQQLVASMMSDDPKHRPTMKHVRSTLEQVYVSLTTDHPEDPDSQEMYLLKRQRRRSTFCLETWVQEATAMDDFMESDIEEEEDDDEGEEEDDIVHPVDKSPKESSSSSSSIIPSESILMDTSLLSSSGRIPQN